MHRKMEKVCLHTHAVVARCNTVATRNLMESTLPWNKGPIKFFPVRPPLGGSPPGPDMLQKFCMKFGSYAVRVSNHCSLVIFASPTACSGVIFDDVKERFARLEKRYPFTCPAVSIGGLSQVRGVSKENRLAFAHYHAVPVVRWVWDVTING